MNTKFFTEDAGEGFRACVGITLVIAIITWPIAGIILFFYDSAMPLSGNINKADLYWTIYRFVLYVLGGSVWLIYLCSLVHDFFNRSKLVKEQSQEKEDKDLQDFIDFCKKR